MVISFRPGHDGPARSDSPGRRRWEGTPDPVALAQDVLGRHGAKILRPATAAMFAGAPTPATTIYRSGVLQLPESLLSDGQVLARLNEILARVGYRLATEKVRPLADVMPEELRGYLPYYPDVHRRVPLEVTGGQGAQPVDAWLALQTLRAAAGTESALADPVDVIELEHLLIGGAIIGSPSSEGHSTPEGAASYSRPGSGGRAPVEVLAPAPPRRTLTQVGDRRPGGRRAGHRHRPASLAGLLTEVLQ